MKLRLGKCGIEDVWCKKKLLVGQALWKGRVGSLTINGL